MSLSQRCRAIYGQPNKILRVDLREYKIKDKSTENKNNALQRHQLAVIGIQIENIKNHIYIYKVLLVANYFPEQQGIGYFEKEHF